MEVGRKDGSWLARTETERASTEDWRGIDRELRRVAKAQAALDAEELGLLGVAQDIELHRELGMASMLEYVERVLGHGPKAGHERLRVARELKELPLTRAALANGAVSFSAVRELTRKVTAETEAEWLATVRGKCLREIEDMLSGRKKGDRPADPIDPDLQLRKITLELTPPTMALFREASRRLADEMGHHLTDDEIMVAMCATVLGGATATADGEWTAEPAPAHPSPREDAAAAPSPREDGADGPSPREDRASDDPSRRKDRAASSDDPSPREDAASHDPSRRKDRAASSHDPSPREDGADDPSPREDAASHDASPREDRATASHDPSPREDGASHDPSLREGGPRELASRSDTARHDRRDRAAAPRTAPYQIALTVCPSCDRGWHDARGRAIAVPDSTIAQAICDAQYIGRTDLITPERAEQEVSPATARLVHRRDRGRCQVPGCRSARWLHIHHIIWREHGGSNDPRNLVCLCFAHHQAVHQLKLSITGSAPDGLVFDLSAFTPLIADAAPGTAPS